MRTLLGAQDAWEVVEVGFEEPAANTVQTANQVKALKEMRMKDKTALYMLFQAVDESGFEKIAGATKSKEAWEILEKAYKGVDRVRQVRLQTLRSELEAMKKEGEAEKKWSKEEMVGDKTNKYCKFVVSLGQETSDVMEQSDVEASAKNVPEESKMSERTVSDERPQESDKVVEQDPEAENSDEVEDDVKVCDICGDVGQEDLLVFCTRCSDGAEHTYCMRVMMKKLPEGEWLCEECQIEVQAEKQKEKQKEVAKFDERREKKTEAKVPEKKPSRRLNSNFQRKEENQEKVKEEDRDCCVEIVHVVRDDANEGKRKRNNINFAETIPVGWRTRSFTRNGKRVDYATYYQNTDFDSEESGEFEESDSEADFESYINLESDSYIEGWPPKEKEKGKEKDKEEKNEENKSGGKKQQNKCDEIITGKRIKVWWPDDKAYYNGTAEKYNRSDKRHTDVYDEDDDNDDDDVDLEKDDVNDDDVVEDVRFHFIQENEKFTRHEGQKEIKFKGGC